MKVKVSKVMANTLNKEAKKQNKQFYFSYVEMEQEQYRSKVSFELLDHTNDYDYEKGKFKVIEVAYPANCYCLPRYLTTNDLIKIVKQTQYSYRNFVNNVFDSVEI